MHEFFEDELEDRDRQAFETHLTSCPKCREEVEFHRSYLALLQSSMQSAKVSEAFEDKVLAGLPEAPAPVVELAAPVHRFPWLRYAAAAAVILFLLSAFFWLPLKPTEEGMVGTVLDSPGKVLCLTDPTGNWETMTTGSPILERATLRTEPGNRAALTLFDGTRIKLNQGTTVSFPAGFKGRRLRLFTGEVWADVATGASPESKPFQIATEHGDVEVTGTELDVKRVSLAKILVTVVTGAVLCSGSTMGPDGISLGAGDQLALGPREDGTPKKVNAGEVIAWTRWPMFRGGPSHRGAVDRELRPHHVQWIYPLSLVERFEGGMVSDEGWVFVGSYGARRYLNPVYALKVEGNTCTLQWVKEIGNVWTSPAVAGDLVLVTSNLDTGFLYALDRKTGGLRWGYSTDSTIKTSPAVVGGLVIFASGDGRVHAVGLNGERRWARKIGPEVHLSSPGGGTADLIFVGALDHKVYALDREGGEVRWRFETDGRLYSSPVVSGDTVFILSEHEWPAEGGSLWAVDAGKGTLKWKRPLDRVSRATPVLREGTLVVALGEGGLMAVDAATGEVLWRASDLPVERSPIAAQESILVLTAPSLPEDSPALTVLDRTSGTVQSTRRVLPGTMEIIPFGEGILALTRRGEMVRMGGEPVPEETRKAVLNARLKALLDHPENRRAAAFRLGNLDKKFTVTVKGRLTSRVFERQGMAGPVRGVRYFLETDAGTRELVPEILHSPRQDKRLTPFLGKTIFVEGVPISGEEPERPDLLPEEREWNRENPLQKIVVIRAWEDF
ncbi:MAG: outer membrane protein assembly factor BamB family protein [Planctomycetota bacterium]